MRSRAGSCSFDFRRDSTWMKHSERDARRGVDLVPGTRGTSSPSTRTTALRAGRGSTRASPRPWVARARWQLRRPTAPAPDALCVGGSLYILLRPGRALRRHPLARAWFRSCLELGTGRDSSNAWTSSGIRSDRRASTRLRRSNSLARDRPRCAWLCHGARRTNTKPYLGADERPACGTESRGCAGRRRRANSGGECSRELANSRPDWLGVAFCALTSTIGVVSGEEYRHGTPNLRRSRTLHRRGL